MVAVSLIPYMHIPIGFFIDLKAIKLNRFANVEVAFWTFSMCITPLLVLAVSQLRPYWMSYIVTIYVNISMLIGFLFLELNVDIKSDWVFRLIALILSIVVLSVSRVSKSYFSLICHKENLSNEIKRVRNAG